MTAMQNAFAEAGFQTPETPEVEVAMTETPEVEVAMTETPEVEVAMTETPEVEVAMTETPEADNVRPDIKFPTGNDLVVEAAGIADSHTHYVERFLVESKKGGNKYAVNLILNRNMPTGRGLLGSICKDRPNGEPVWSHRDDQRVVGGFKGIIYPLCVNGETLVVFQTIGHEPKVMHVVSFSDLVEGKSEARIAVNVNRKRMVGNILLKLVDDIEVWYSQTEERVLAAAATDLSKKLRPDNTVAVRQVRLEREKKTAEIMVRHKHVEWVDGKKLVGVPVTDDELMFVTNGSFVFVGTFADDDKFVPVEHCKVLRTGRGLEKTKATPIEQKAELPEARFFHVLQVGEDYIEVPVYANTQALEAHQRAGLNAGTLTGIVTDDGFTYFKVHHDKLVPLEAAKFTFIG